MENKIKRKLNVTIFFGKDMSVETKSSFGVKLPIGKVRW